MSSDLFRQYINIINENSQPEEKGPNKFQKAYHSGEGPIPPEPIETIDDPAEIADLIHQAYNTTDGSDLEQNAHNASVRKMVKAALLEISPKEERILRMRFGIGVPKMTLDEIGQKFGLSGNRIRQIADYAMRKMKHPSRMIRKSEKKTMPPRPDYYSPDREKAAKDGLEYYKAYHEFPSHLE